jgi:hypothetical protein
MDSEIDWTRCPLCAEKILLAAIKCKHCGSYVGGPIYDPIIGPPLPVSSPVSTKKSIWNSPVPRWVFFAMAAFWLAKWSGVFESSKNDSTSLIEPVAASAAAATPSLPDLTSEVTTNGFIVTIKNLDDYAWQDCSVDINQGLLSAYEAHVENVGADQAVTLYATQFADGSTRFNPATTKIQSIYIECTTAKGQQYSVARFQ